MPKATEVLITRDFDLAAWREPVPPHFHLHAPQMVPVWICGLDDEGWILVNRRVLPEFLAGGRHPPMPLMQ